MGAVGTVPSYGIVHPLTIQKFIDDPRGPVNRKIHLIANDVSRTAQILATRDLGKIPGDAPRTGTLARSFRVSRQPRPSTWKVRNISPYFAPIELGARPHAIRATGMSGRRALRQKASLAARATPKVSSGLKRYKAPKTVGGAHLQFQARDGRWVKTKQVSHPGNRPYHILTRAMFLSAQRNLTNVRRIGSARQIP